MHSIFLHRHFSTWQRSLLAIFVTALLIRSVFIFTLQNGFYFLDSLEYSQAATNLLAHGTFGEAYDRAPMYPLVLAAIYALFGHHIVAIRLVQAVMGACIAVMIALIAQRIGSKGTGVLAGVLWSVYPLGVFIAGLEYPTSVTTLFLAGTVLCMLPNMQQALGSGRVICSAFLVGAAALAIPNTLAVVLPIALWILYWQSPRRVVLATLFLLGVALTLTPWTIRNLYTYGNIVIVDPRLTQATPRVGPEGVVTDSLLERRIKFFWGDPVASVARVVREFGHFWELYPTRVTMSHQSRRDMYHEQDPRVVKQTAIGTVWTDILSIMTTGPIFLFALIGTGTLWVQKEQRPALSLLCMTTLSFALGYAFLVGKTRYRIPVEPYVIILSAYGLEQTWSLLAGQRIRARLCRVRGAEPAVLYPQPTNHGDESGPEATKASFGKS
jgi:4-amino-4-deoxy-L-arabinose transferase-like glycosyltransferase